MESSVRSEYVTSMSKVIIERNVINIIWFCLLRMYIDVWAWLR